MKVRLWGPEKRQRMKNGLCPPAGHGARGDQTTHGQLQYKMQSAMEGPGTPRQGSGEHGGFSEKELSIVGPEGGRKEGKERNWSKNAFQVRCRAYAVLGLL